MLLSALKCGFHAFFVKLPLYPENDFTDIFLKHKNMINFMIYADVTVISKKSSDTQNSSHFGNHSTYVSKSIDLSIISTTF